METVRQSGDSNRRRAPRRATRVLGYVVERGRDDRECLLLDMSAAGARLQLTAPAAKPFQPPVTIPDTFVLVVVNDRTEVDCVTTWRKGNGCGVRFVSSFRPVSSWR
jgi:hypothetical protein